MSGSRMRNVIVGTAGHIDHGKTALVRALTGIETDRLEEEKRRGISIDLGFAHLDVPGVHLGLVDVPGHERFVRNMLAGVGGIDLVMLIIAADESIKPQTREHFDICRLLGIRHGIVVLTKSDLVAPDLLDLVKLEVEEYVAGSFLEGAPIVAVSSKTGEGLDALRTCLRELALRVEPHDSSGLPRLPLDRSFTMRGFGTVVTGTLLAGVIAQDQEVEAYPANLRLRVRGIQVHSRPVAKAEAGQRTALNLAGVEAPYLRRGMVLGPPGVLTPTRAVDTRFQLLGSAQPLKHRAPVHFHAATSETEAEVRLLEGIQPVQPGATVWARFLLKDPLLLLPGDHFIVRMFSPVITIGGGVVLDNAPAPKMRKPEAVAHLEQLDGTPLARQMDLLVGQFPDGISISTLVARLGQPESRIQAAAREAGLFCFAGASALLISQAAFEKNAARLRSAVTEFHSAHPLLPGLSRTHAPVPPFLLEGLLAACRDVVAEGDVLRLVTHRLALKEDEGHALSRMEALFERAGLAAPATAEVLAQSGVEPSRARSLLQILLRQGKLTRVGTDLIYHTAAITSLRGQLAGRRGRRFSVTDFKDWTGVSRKYAIPLLEYLDRERVTRREGDQRLIL
jgi:selenocysteine-specific elongation factor